MKIRRKTVLNIILFAFILSFFVTPLGNYAKLVLNKILTFSPKIEHEKGRQQITDYDWKLKDADWRFFNFKKSKGRVVFLNFWATWELPCQIELQSIQNLYDKYHDRVDFYIITDEEREPVEAFMAQHGFTFPVTYLIIGEKHPLETTRPMNSYLLDKDGTIVIQKKGIADWDNTKVYELLDKMLTE
ncbi:TlpA disulfide reductase family protein [Arenibacter sp. GZD96]|uniref:TlpA family protein disulfide reductase n=1 Tax=Aurantibrevibacter litoralis TaxID=3106030 RepID=UPI002AFDF11E|nr:TlpA disulfide reductase family protein [Arenibacter sp. GZD-96]MEA1786229.1 TlpA disulfide reductase family protein [Arenibacter sp. GZD-96]